MHSPNVSEYDFCVFSATVDVKKNIYDLSINKYGSQIAIVENQGGYDSGQESAVRIYSVGRKKNMEDEAEEDDEEMAVSDDGTISDNDSVGKSCSCVFCRWQSVIFLFFYLSSRQPEWGAPHTAS